MNKPDIFSEYRLDIAELGAVFIYITERGIYGLSFADTPMNRHFKKQLQDYASSPSYQQIAVTDTLVEAVHTQLQEYLIGKRHSFDLPVDLRCFKNKKGQIQQQLPNIPYGQTSCYRDFALSTGNPRAWRFVGTAVAENPLPIIYPCHRVIRADGSLGNYQGGIFLKHYLIELEAAIS